MKKDQSQAQDFTIYDQNGIKITLTLPAALQINQNRQEFYPPVPTPGAGTPVLHNNTAFPITSASFVINLDDVKDGSSNVIANVRWWNNNSFDGQQSMTFSCGAVASGGTAPLAPATAGYSQVRWGTTVSSGRGTESFTNTVSLVSLTFGPLPPQQTPQNGPIVQVG